MSEEEKKKKEGELGILSVLSWRKVKMWKWSRHHEVTILWKHDGLPWPGFPCQEPFPSRVRGTPPCSQSAALDRPLPKEMLSLSCCSL